jgi:competence protein ComEC
LDDIQRKLALIDEQLGGGRNFHSQIISTSPLVFAAVGLIFGIFLQDLLSLPVWFWLIVLAAVAVVSILAFAFPKISLRPPIFAYTALVCFMCLGGIRSISYSTPRANDIRNFIASERKLATIRGLIVNKPRSQYNRDWAFARFKFTDPASSFYLKIRQVQTVNGWTAAGGKVRVTVDESVLDLAAGDYIQAYCWLERFKSPGNPGQFDVNRYLARRNVFIAASVKSRQGIELLRAKNAGAFTKVRTYVRQAAAEALLGDSLEQGPRRALLEALLLGYRGNIDSDTYRAFQKTGLLHFISLSGMHFGILVGIIWWLSKTMGLLKRGRAAVCIIATAVFVLVLPPRAPTLRAAIICGVFCLSFFFRRSPNSLNSLSLAAIILLLLRPTNLFEAGWQLSFASVLGILLFCHRIHLFLYEEITFLPWRWKAPKTKPFFRIISRPGPYLLRLFSTGLTAWLGGAGILLYHFYTINPFTSIWTVITFPLVAAILTVGFLKIVLSFFLPSAAGLLGVVAAVLCDWLVGLVKLIEGLSPGQVLIGRVGVGIIVLYYVTIVFAGFFRLRESLLKKVVCSVMVVVLVFWVGALKWQRVHRDNLIIHCLDVGHGQSIVAQLPGGDTILFDAGSLHHSNIGERMVNPFLNYMGIDRIDAIIISHNDVDHINGIPEVVKTGTVKSVYANEPFFAKADRWGTAKFLAERLKENGHELRSLSQELELNSSAKISFIWPDKEQSPNEQLSDNDKSLVVLIEYAGRKILLCSDIEIKAQRKLLGLYPNLKAQVVVVPHHGSARTLQEGFLQKLQAEILICSCSSRAFEKGQITQPKIQDTQSYYTGPHGQVTVSVSKDGTLKASCHD